ncbi:hypothetical protein CHUAL_001794 [Chamberlinius hualienensis]
MFYHWTAGRKNGSGGGGSGGGSSNVTSSTNTNMESLPSSYGTATAPSSSSAAAASARHLRTHLFFGGSPGAGDNMGNVSNQRRNSQIFNLNDVNQNNSPSRHLQNINNYENGLNDGSPTRSPTKVNSKDKRNIGSNNNNNFEGQNNIKNAPNSLLSNNNNNMRAPFIQISCPTPVEGIPPTPFGATNTPGSIHRSRSSTRSTVKTPSPARSSSSSAGGPVAGRQASRSGRLASAAGSTASSSSSETVVTLSLAGAIQQLHEDCFIIPAHRMNSFLPVALLDSEKQQVGSLNMMHVDDPKLCIILHFAEPSPPSLTIQLTALRASLSRLKQTGAANEGMILMNIERRANYPFIVYLVVNSTQTTPCAFLHSYNTIIMDELSPEKLGITETMEMPGLNYISGYEEVATIARPPIDIHPKVPSNPKAGFLITIFKVFPGDDREKLERSWLLWTGARVIYKNLPNCLGMRKITFHKKLWPDGGITYVLICECTEMMDYVTIACGFVEHLRARCCGYTGIYKNVENFDYNSSNSNKGF